MQSVSVIGLNIQTSGGVLCSVLGRLGEGVSEAVCFDVEAERGGNSRAEVEAEVVCPAVCGGVV